MKILLLGSLVSQEAMEQLNQSSREKASVAPVNYETMLARGLRENGATVEAMSVPAVAAYPGSVFKRLPAKEEQLEGGIPVRWIPFINLPFLKQWTIRRNATKALKAWLKAHRDEKDKVVLMYSIYPPYSAPALRLCRRYGCHLSVVIADLPEYMYTWKQSKGLRGLYARHLSRQMLALQGGCDSYVLFTEKMAARMGVSHKPYMVSEGLSDVSLFDGLADTEKHAKKTIVYAGNLSRLYGIRSLVDGFMQLTGDYELHLYGAGGDADYVQACAEKDPRIRYFGRVPRNTVLPALKKAHLIAINKPTADDYSNYSFSSKILECMASGTPVLTTRVGGMPPEYYDYVYFIEDETPCGITAALESALHQDEAVLEQFGSAAAAFAREEKNYRVMTAAIQHFLRERINN